MNTSIISELATITLLIELQSKDVVHDLKCYKPNLAKMHIKMLRASLDNVDRLLSEIEEREARR